MTISRVDALMQVAHRENICVYFLTVVKTAYYCFEYGCGLRLSLLTCDIYRHTSPWGMQTVRRGQERRMVGRKKRCGQRRGRGLGMAYRLHVGATNAPIITLIVGVTRRSYSATVAQAYQSYIAFKTANSGRCNVKIWLNRTCYDREGRGVGRYVVGEGKRQNFHTLFSHAIYGDAIGLCGTNK